MRFESDWPYVRRHTMRPVLSAMIALACLGSAAWLHDTQERQFFELEANYSAVYEDHDTLVRQRRLVDRYHRRYQRFHDLGFIGHESRLDWVETLRRAANTLALPRLTYSIEPQLEVIPPVNSVVGGEDMQLRTSKVQLEMALLHEVDLLRFFDELQANAPGLIRVDSCQLSWQGDAGAQAAFDLNLTANCAVQLYSVITSDVVAEDSSREGSAND